MSPVGDITGVVLAGGLGSRMGRDKALLPGPGGRPLVVDALDALEAAGCRPLLVSVPAGGASAALGRAVGARAALVADRAPGEGPLGGIAAALEACATPWALVVACDMPRLDARALAAVLDAARAHPERALVIPRAGGRAHPLHAAWRRDVAPAIRARLALGQRRVLELVAARDPLWLDAPQGGAGWWAASFVNWNEPGPVPDE